MGRLALTLWAVTVVSCVLAAAASLGGVASSKVGSEGTAVPSCDADGFSPTYTTSGGNVTSVAVGGIADPGCEGGSLSLTLTNNGSSIGSGGPQTVPTDADTSPNSMSVSISPTPDAGQLNGISVTVVGP